MYRYIELLEDGVIARRKLDSPKLERYDEESKRWIPDWSLSEVFTGDIRTAVITEDEAWRKLNLRS